MGLKMIPADRRRFDKRIANLQAFSTVEVQLAMHKTIVETVNRMKTDVPVDTGELRNSIKGTQAGSQASITADADHAAPIEYGTRFMSAQPFFFKNIREGIRRFQTRISKAFINTKTKL